MRHAQRSDTATGSKQQHSQHYRKDDDVLDDATVLAHLEADFEPDCDGDPVRGLAVGVSLGTAIWLVLFAVAVWL